MAHKSNIQDVSLFSDGPAETISHDRRIRGVREVDATAESHLVTGHRSVVVAHCFDRGRGTGGLIGCVVVSLNRYVSHRLQPIDGVGREIFFRDVLADVPLTDLPVGELVSLDVDSIGVLTGVGQVVVSGPDGGVFVGEGD